MAGGPGSGRPCKKSFGTHGGGLGGGAGSERRGWPPKSRQQGRTARAAEGGGWARREAGRFPGFTKERRGRLSEGRWRRQLSAPPPRRRPGAVQNCGE